MATCLLQKAAAAGLTLYEIASLVSRPFDGLADDCPSELERVCEAARRAVEAAAAASAPPPPLLLLSAAGDELLEGDDCDGECGSEEGDSLSPLGGCALASGGFMPLAFTFHADCSCSLYASRCTVRRPRAAREAAGRARFGLRTFGAPACVVVSNATWTSNKPC